jgi:hypothetical protein
MGPIRADHQLAAGFEDFLVFDDRFVVVARPAIITVHVVRGLDAGRSRLHGETDIHVAEPAGELRPVKPMIEHHRREPGLFGKIVDDDPAEFVREGSFFLDHRLSEGSTRNYASQHQEQERSLHRSPPLMQYIPEKTGILYHRRFIYVVDICSFPMCLEKFEFPARRLE